MPCLACLSLIKPLASLWTSRHPNLQRILKFYNLAPWHPLQFMIGSSQSLVYLLTQEVTFQLGRLMREKSRELTVCPYPSLSRAAPQTYWCLTGALSIPYSLSLNCCGQFCNGHLPQPKHCTKGCRVAFPCSDSFSAPPSVRVQAGKQKPLNVFQQRELNEGDWSRS